MTKPNVQREKTLAIVRSMGVARSRDLKACGIPRDSLVRLVREGGIDRLGRGIYIAADHPVTENHDIAQACKRVPNGIVCLLSALRLHGLTTQGPSDIWLALPEKARRPRIDHPPLRIARFSGEALTAGVEYRNIEGVRVPVYSAAKTVADCFKYRNKIGSDVAVEALRDYLREHRGGAEEVWRYARICRVARVIQPYLEAMQ